MKNHINPGVGAASILMIFVILCVTTFGILSFSTARSDWKLTQKNAEALQRYYTADAKAQLLLQELDSRLVQLTEGAPERSRVELVAEFSGSTIQTVPLEAAENPAHLLAILQVGDLQELQLELELSATAPHYRVVRYQLTPSAEWSGDEQLLPVWQG